MKALKKRPHTIPPRAVPHVKRLFVEMNRLDMSCARMAKEAGVCEETIKNWRGGTAPQITAIEACFNVAGLTLQPVPLEEQ